MDLLTRFKKYITEQNLLKATDHVLVAVSGGVDSTVLCELCKQSNIPFTIAHCNFQLRANESERDQIFVQALGKKYGVRVMVKRFETKNYAAQKNISIQVAARDLRYQWFHEIISQPILSPDEDSSFPEIAPVILLTAHHLEDNVETMLMNFFKGTGITGLRGILPKHDKVIRPLLFARKEEIKAFATDHELTWVEDSSNEKNEYARNYLRHELIPVIQNIYPEAENNLAKNLLRFRDVELLYLESVALHKKRLLEKRGNEYYIAVLKLQKSIPLETIIFEIIKDFGFHPSQVSGVVQLLDSETGKYVASVSHRLIKHRKWLIMAPLASTEAETILVESGTSQLTFTTAIDQQATLRFEDVLPDVPINNHPMTALLDKKEIAYPLILRKWKAGDYFYPLGMKKKKKLSRFFIDQKLSKTAKEKVWVFEMNRKIVWVIGYRIDDRFKVSANTESMLKISFHQL